MKTFRTARDGATHYHDTSIRLPFSYVRFYLMPLKLLSVHFISKKTRPAERDMTNVKEK
jgi:hypothetical protein